MNMKINTTREVFHGENGSTLTPYVNENGDLLLASGGNGCGDDVILEDISGWTDVQINETWDDLDLDALRDDAAEIREAGRSDIAEWIEDWCTTCETARTGYVYPEMVGRDATDEDADAVVEYLNSHGYIARTARGDDVGESVKVSYAAWNKALAYAAKANGWND